MGIRIPKARDNQDGNSANNRFQNNIIKSLQPITSNPLVQGIILQDIQLVAGSNTVNHKLNRVMQGWSIVDIQAAATIYRTEAFNATSLTLNVSASCTVNLYVF